MHAEEMHQLLGVVPARVLTAFILIFVVASGVHAASPATAYLMSSNPPCDNPGYCETLWEIAPIYGPSWHVFAVEETWGDSAGLVRMDGEFLGSDKQAVLYRYQSKVFFVGLEQSDTLFFEFNDYCGTPFPRPPLPPPVPPLFPHAIKFCITWQVDEWIDNGDGEFSIGDSLIMFDPNKTGPVLHEVEVVAVNCGWYVEIAEGIPTLTEWGLIIFGVLLAGWMAWMIIRRKKKATAAT